MNQIVNPTFAMCYKFLSIALSKLSIRRKSVANVIIITLWEVFWQVAISLKMGVYYRIVLHNFYESA